MQQLEQIALQTRHDRLRLRVAEAAVEFEDTKSRVGHHQTGIQESYERRASPRQLRQHRTVNRLEEFFDFRRPESRHRRVGAQRFVDFNSAGELLADQFVTAGKLGVAGERILDALRVAAAQCARRRPRQEVLDRAAL